MKKRFATVFAVAVLAASMVSCSSTEPTPDGTGNLDSEAIVKVVPRLKITELDVHQTTSNATSDITRIIAETLLTRDSKAKIQPMLAEGYQISEDGKTYTFKLRKGVKFHDGSDLTAADVVASMQHWSKLSSPGKAYFSKATWTEIDTHTVTLEVPEPSFGILLALSHGREQFPAIYPKALLDSAVDGKLETIIGTGPFKFVKFVPDQYLEVEKFAEYQPVDAPRDGLSGDRTAEVAGIRFELITDSATKILGLQTGEYDVVVGLDFDAAAQLESDPNLKIASYPENLLTIYYNKKQGPFANQKAREAIHTLIDREALLMAAVGNPNYFKLNYQMMLYDQQGVWNTTVGKDDFNPHNLEAAKALFAESGLKPGDKIVLASNNAGVPEHNTLILIQDELTKLGYEVQYDQYESAAWSDIRKDPSKWDMTVISNTTKAEPSTLVFFNSDFPGWTNDPALGPLLADFRGSKTIEEAQEKYPAIQEWVNSYLPVSKLGDTSKVYGTTNKIGEIGIQGGALWWYLTKSK